LVNAILPTYVCVTDKIGAYKCQEGTRSNISVSSLLHCSDIVIFKFEFCVNRPLHENDLTDVFSVSVTITFSGITNSYFPSDDTVMDDDLYSTSKNGSPAKIVYIIFGTLFLFTLFASICNYVNKYINMKPDPSFAYVSTDPRESERSPVMKAFLAIKRAIMGDRGIDEDEYESPPSWLYRNRRSQQVPTSLDDDDEVIVSNPVIEMKRVNKI
jgi:hypothetical protein